MAIKETNYCIKNGNQFVIENYNYSKIFANFLPGIAGKTGKPMWTFYVNRNQAFCSIGVKNKDNQILDFLSFNKALQSIQSQGFRTFIKIDNKDFYEPFCPTVDNNITQKMIVTADALEIVDTNNLLGIQTTVKYFLLVQEEIPGFIRKVNVSNLKKDNRTIDVVDGLPRIIPFGTDRDCINVTARHIEGLMQVYNIGNFPVYKLKINPEDKPEIEILQGGNFYASFFDNKIYNKYIIDPAILFDIPENFDFPSNFIDKNIDVLLSEKQIFMNRTPSAFTVFNQVKLNEINFYSLIGYADSDSRLKRISKIIGNAPFDYFKEKEVENFNVIESIQNDMLTVSSSNNFDKYCGQSYLDNVLRGGKPEVFETDTGKSVFYLYSRQNGDLERDYHNFILEPTYYSQGNSHYRCVVQNRRSDNFFKPAIDDYNMRFFLNLMQLDGYNPIEISITKYILKNEEGFKSWLNKNVNDDNFKTSLSNLFNNPLTPGEILEFLMSETSNTKEANVKMLTAIMSFCKEDIVIDLHPRLGFWIDQWSYNLDLIESYLRIYPDNIKDVFLSISYTFFDNSDFVLPRHKKYILFNGQVRQYEAVERNSEKLNIINNRKSNPNTVRKDYGKGEIFETNLIVKLLTLITNRMATLDPENAGLEMEANKPGWNDSINGLPGILGSSLCHSLQLERFTKFLMKILEDNFNSNHKIFIFDELLDFMNELKSIIDKFDSSKSDDKNFVYWDESHCSKEKYREKIRFGVSGAQSEIDINFVVGFLNNCMKILSTLTEDANKDKIFDGTGIPYTYYINDGIEWKETSEKDSAGHPFVKVLKFNQRPVSLFLEGPVHFLKVHPERAKKVYDAIKNSDLYDTKLNSYKSCVSLENETFEIGRIKAWGRGWLENESVYTHMLFKYLLETLEAELYNDFYDDIKNIIMPFLKPKVYGRSIFENVSFIVSSAFIDEKMHGQGFQARLSGSTCEWIQIWTIMCAGKNFFYRDDSNNLILKLNPVLPGWLFTNEDKSVNVFYSENNSETVNIPKNSFAFKFLGKTLVVYRNDKRSNTFALENNDSVSVKSYELEYFDGKKKKISESAIQGETALDIRKGLVKIITADLK